MDKYSIESTYRNGKLLIAIYLGTRSIGSIFLVDEDKSFISDLEELIKKWNLEIEERI